MAARTGGLITIACAVLAMFGTACNSRIPTEVAVDQIDVVDQPYPPNYRSSQPINPRIVATLHRGDRLYVRDQEADKDFMYYTVELPNGQRGYVIFNGDWPFQEHNFHGFK